MSEDRAMSTLADPDQWTRCSHQGTALVDDGRGVELAWTPPLPASPSPTAGAAAGLAFDRWCRAYRSWPEHDRVVALEAGVAGADGAPPAHCPGALPGPRGLAVDDDQRLYVTEPDGGTVLVTDLWSERLVRRVRLRPLLGRRCRPLDVAPWRGGALALVDIPPALVAVCGRPRTGPPLRAPRGRSGLRPSRLATDGAGRVLVLWVDEAGEAGTVAEPDGAALLTLPGASDLELCGDVLVVAGPPGAPLRRWRCGGPGDLAELEPLFAPAYDGGALGVTPDGRLAVTTGTGFGFPGGSAATYRSQGRVVSYRLDAGDYRTRWGRLFLDACLPASTDVRVRFLTSDEDEVMDPLSRTPPAHGEVTVRAAETTPPLPPLAGLALLPDALPVVRRPTGREWPWAQIAADDAYETYEAPVNAAPGRYLWVVLELSGTTRATPRVRSIRVERPGHRLATQLPRGWTRDEADAAFLQRFLAPAEGLLHELDQRSASRDALLDPATTPQEALSWLAGFVGLVLDRRWPLEARRTLVAQAYDLFRLRGTVAALERMVTLYIGRPSPVVERWRLRGIGGAVLGLPADGPPAPAVKEAARAIEPLGRFTLGGALPGQAELGDGSGAHRFTVLVPEPLDVERRQVVRAIIEANKPVHTMGELCELTGMRIGGGRVGLTTLVGAGASWGPAVVGQVRAGRDGLLGTPTNAARVGSATVGAVRVG